MNQSPKTTDWTLEDCIGVAKQDAHVASCEYLDRPCMDTKRELSIAGSALAQLENLARKSKHQPKA